MISHEYSRPWFKILNRAQGILYSASTRATLSCIVWPVQFFLNKFQEGFLAYVGWNRPQGQPYIPYYWCDQDSENSSKTVLESILEQLSHFFKFFSSILMKIGNVNF